MKRKKILFLISRFPYPLIGGDKIKSFYLMKHLAKYHDVTLAALSFKNLPELDNIKALTDIGVKVHSLPVKPLSDGIKAALSFHKVYPFEVSFYLKNNFQNLVDKLCYENNYDIGIAFFLRTAEYIKDKKFKKILISEDCRQLYQTRSYQSSNNIFQKMIRKWEVNKLKKYEPDIVNYFDIITLVTNQDIAEMKKYNNNQKYRLVTNGVNVDEFSPPESNSNRKDLLFTGKLSVQSNTLMAIKIANTIMPEIVKKYPNIKLHLVGSNPSATINSLANDNIEIHSNVPDIAKFYKESRVFIHPHLAATGIQNKLLEAMSTGMPSVTTTTGIQGIDGVDGQHFLIGNTTDDFIDKTISLLQDDYQYEKISQNARQLILRNHTWETIYNQFDSVIDELS